MEESFFATKLPHLPEKTRRVVSQFCAELVKAFGGNLTCLIIFGSAARVPESNSNDDFKEGVSDINTALVFDKITVAELSVIRDIGRKFRKYRIAAPLIFKSDHISTSLDTFPLEFSDMKENHISLYGKDPLEGAVIENKNLRHQCEVEFKGKLIQLRRAFVQIPGDSESLRQLMAGSINSILTACRGMLRLKGQSSPSSVPKILDLLERDYKIDVFAIRKVWKLKQGEIDESTAMLERLFDEYLATIKQLATLVDSM